MKLVSYFLITSCLIVLLLSGYPALGEGPLPEFEFQGVVLHPDDLKYSPKDDLIHPTLIKTEGLIKNPLGKYYLYYAPHKHVAISMSYSDSLDGPWTEYKHNPVIEGPSAPDIRWIAEHGRFHMWGHLKNGRTELWTSEDGLTFEHQGVSVDSKNIGTKNASYSRVYEYPLKKHGSRYIMLYTGFLKDREIRCVWLAHSKDAVNWTQLKTPLVEPIANEMKDLYGPAFLRWKGRN
ncbi:MAG: glycoside hydrolase family protein, partial [Planctomycetota bacterium]